MSSIRGVAQDPLAPIGQDEKQLIWKFKHFILSHAEALPKFIQCIQWDDYRQVPSSNQVASHVRMREYQLS